MPLNLFAYMNKIGLSIRPILLWSNCLATVVLTKLYQKFIFLVITFNKTASQESINYASFLDTLLKTKNKNKIVYRKLIEKKRKQLVNSQTKWSADCMIEINEPIDWKAAYRLPFECMKISQLRVFQFKLLHRRLATND